MVINTKNTQPKKNYVKRMDLIFIWQTGRHFALWSRTVGSLERENLSTVLLYSFHINYLH